MKDKYISYYELLGMIKEGNIPKRIYVKIANYGMYYIADYDGEEFSYYELQDKDRTDENYHFYLSECFLESSMFDKCIQVLDEEEFEDIEILVLRTFERTGQAVTTDRLEDYCDYNFEMIENIIAKMVLNQKKIIEKLNKEN